MYIVPKDTSTALNFDAALTGFLLAYKHISLSIFGNSITPEHFV